MNHTYALHAMYDSLQMNLKVLISNWPNTAHENVNKYGRQYIEDKEGNISVSSENAKGKGKKQDRFNGQKTLFVVKSLENCFVNFFLQMQF